MYLSFFFSLLYCIDRRIYLDLFNSSQSSTGLKALKPAANGRSLMCKSSPYYFHWLYISTFILLSAKCMLRLSVMHWTLTWTTWSLTCVRDHSCACIYTRGVGHSAGESAQHFWIEKTYNFFYCAPDGIRTCPFGSWVRRSTHWATPVTPSFPLEVQNVSVVDRVPILLHDGGPSLLCAAAGVGSSELRPID